MTGGNNQVANNEVVKSGKLRVGCVGHAKESSSSRMWILMVIIRFSVLYVVAREIRR